MSRLDSQDTKFRSLVAFLYYAPLRIVEIVGDGPKKWKILSRRGRALSREGSLPEDWQDRNRFWEWRYRDPVPGIKKGDISLDGLLLQVISKPLKHGKRGDDRDNPIPLEIDIRYPYVDLIIQQWERTENPEDSVWEGISPWLAWSKISKISEGELYPHAFRFSKATDMARDPDISLADMLYWFGWSQARTADNYIQQARSSARVRHSTERHLPEGWDKQEHGASRRGISLLRVRVPRVRGRVSESI